jgi:hypothetical protein
MTAPKYIWIKEVRLVSKTNPGAWEYRRNDDGSYAHARVILGGSGYGQTTARKIAEQLWRDHQARKPLTIIRQLGWHDVAEAYREVEVKETKLEELKADALAAKIELEKDREVKIEKMIEEKIVQLEDELAGIELLSKDGRHKDYELWSNKLGDELWARPIFVTSEGVSVREGYSPGGGMAWVATYEKKVAELKELREESDSGS